MDKPKDTKDGPNFINQFSEGAARLATQEDWSEQYLLDSGALPNDKQHINGFIAVEPKEVVVSPNYFMMLEKTGPSRILEGKVFQDFAHVPKHEPTGQGRISPIRSLGESESRLSSMVTDGLIKAEQLKQVLLRGANADFDGNALDGGVYVHDIDVSIFSRINPGRFNEKPESTSASKALVQKPLEATEYANRKLQAANAEVHKLMAEGMTREEAIREIEYQHRENRKLTQQIPEEEWAPGVKEHLAQVDAFIKNHPDPVLNLTEVELKRSNKERLTPEEHTFYVEQVMLRRHELFPEAEGYDQFQDPMRHQKGKVAFLDIQVDCLLVNKTPGWAADIVELRKQQAELMREIQGLPPVEPPAPPPVLDFSTADLEQPERFIIKDLEGFKFDPATKFDGLRLPYESCLFVLGMEPLRAVVLATQEADDVISLKLLSEQKAELPWHSIATLYVRLNGTRARLKWANTKRTLDKRLGMVSSVLAFLAGEQLGDVEVTTVVTAPEGREIPPPKPGYCYNVVSIVHEKRKAQRRDWQGGTHASPREHKRKGHWWPSPKGGFLWRGPVIVNKGVLGRVDKEYHVTKLIEAAP